MDDERLKRGTYLTEKYFDEQLERIREIRASEKNGQSKCQEKQLEFRCAVWRMWLSNWECQKGLCKENFQKSIPRFKSS